MKESKTDSTLNILKGLQTIYPEGSYEYNRVNDVLNLCTELKGCCENATIKEEDLKEVDLDYMSDAVINTMFVGLCGEFILRYYTGSSEVVGGKPIIESIETQNKVESASDITNVLSVLGRSELLGFILDFTEIIGLMKNVLVLNGLIPEESEDN